MTRFSCFTQQHIEKCSSMYIQTITNWFHGKSLCINIKLVFGIKNRNRPPILKTLKVIVEKLNKCCSLTSMNSFLTRLESLPQYEMGNLYFPMYFNVPMGNQYGYSSNVEILDLLYSVKYILFLFCWKAGAEIYRIYIIIYSLNYCSSFGEIK